MYPRGLLQPAASGWPPEEARLEETVEGEAESDQDSGRDPGQGTQVFLMENREQGRTGGGFR